MSMRRVHEHDDDEEEEETDLATISNFSHGYDDEPIFKCKNCASKNPGYEEKEASLLTVVAAVVSLLIFRLYSFLILPLVIESTKTITKKCVKCDHILDKQELLSMPSLTDKILNFKCGNCAVVISRKYVLVIIAILTIIWFFIPSSEPPINPGGQTLNNVRWEDFVEDCGRKVVLNNQVRAKRSFEEKYAKNIIKWRGVVHSKVPREKIKDPFFREVILVKMNPSDSKEEFPDIQLVCYNNLGAKSIESLKIIQSGDIVEFKAMLRAMGDEFHYHELETLSISYTGQKMDLGQIPMINYSGAPNLRKGQTPTDLDSTFDNQDMNSGDDRVEQSNNGNQIIENDLNNQQTDQKDENKGQETNNQVNTQKAQDNENKVSSQDNPDQPSPLNVDDANNSDNTGVGSADAKLDTNT